MSEYVAKKYHILTFGCQANMADSSTIAGILEALGFEKAFSFEESDLFIVNTCSVRQKSEDKVYGFGKIVKEHLEAGNSKPFIVMAGCMVGSVTGSRQRFEFERLQKKTPWVDAYMNPAQLHKLPNILLEKGILDEWALSKFDPNEVFNNDVDNNHAFINISFGCDNYCTFCVVPFSRGKEVSRSKEEILREIKHLTLRGVNSITLCGQNVNSWGLSPKEKFGIRSGSNQKLPFADLLRSIHEIDEIQKIDFLSSNPFDFTQDLIETLKLPKISNYLHIAIQSGNNEVLKNMNRRHTVEEFFFLVDKIKEARPDMELGTDIIVGFPGETEEQFEDTVKLFEKVYFNVAYISMYSRRKGTAADKFLKDDIPLAEKKRRHARLTKVWNQTKTKQSQ